ncbi:MAG: PAS domain S-box protein [Flavobacteriales bacterium]|nr:PAS domain S-box protein [Bacteroidota bacterium]MCB9240436.1 PAS domain S-box protein [Flavobacteriales bacterium]
MKLETTREELQKHFDSVIESAIDGILIIDQQGTILESNAAVTKLFGYDKDELLGSNITMLMPQPHRDLHDSYVRNYLETGMARIIGIGREVDGLKKDGTLFPFRLSVSEVKIESGSYFTGFVHDLTHEKEANQKLQEYAQQMEEKVHERTAQLQEEIEIKERTERALMESQKLYEAIAVNFPNGTITVLNEKLEFTFVEGTGLKDIGVRTSDLLGKHYLDVIDSGIRPMVEEKLQLVFQGKHCHFEIELNHLVFRVRAVPLPNERDEIDRILLVETNITQQKKAEEEIFNSLRKEKELNVLKSRFVSMASHEFRTPLSTIMSSASLIERYPLTDDQPKRLKHTDRIKGNVRNLTMILNDFLSLEKLDEDRLRTNLSTFNLKEFVDQVADELSTLRKPGQRITVLTCNDESTITTDQFMLQNILNNLISNAVKYSPEEATITIEINREEAGFKVVISDTGRGISPDDLKLLFNRFFRASNAGNEQGTGLGLYIVQRYLDLLGGSIHVKSELNKGTSFTVHLPSA